MRLLRQKWILLTALAAVGVCAAVFVAHLVVDADHHPESCALCAAAQHGPALATAGIGLDPALRATLAPGALPAVAALHGARALCGSRAPPRS